MIVSEPQKNPASKGPKERLSEAFRGRGSGLADDGLSPAAGEREKTKTTDEEGAEITAIMELGGDEDESEYPHGGRRSLKKRDKEFLDLLLLILAIEDDIARIEAIIEFHEEQMGLIARLIREARDLLTELQEREEALKEALDRFREKGSFDLDGDGAFKNGKAEAALQAYEQKTGKLIDRRDPGSYSQVQAALEDVRAEEAEIEAGIEADQKDYDRHKAKRDEAIEIREALQSGDPARQKQGLERMKALGYDQRIETSAGAILKEAGLVESDLMQDSFSFGFPPIKDDFQKSAVGGDAGEPAGQEPPTESGVKKKPPGLAPR